MFGFMHSEGVILWWQNFTAKEGIEAGICTHIAVSMKSHVCLQVPPKYGLSGVVGRVLVSSMRIVSPTVTRQFPVLFRVIFGGLSPPSSPCGIPCLAQEPWQHQAEITWLGALV